MLQSIPCPEDYDVSPVNGFLPAELPLEKLAHPYYAPWENIISNLQGLILSRRIRGTVCKLPVLSTDYLFTEPEWRRAYSILAFMSHAYIWGGDQPEEIVPPSISRPFIVTCEHFDLPRVATYAGVVLWNFKPLFHDEPLDLENLSTLQTFTGSIDESWFYLVSVAIEVRGAPLIPLLLKAMAAARQHDRLTVTSCLQASAELIDALSSLFVRMYDSCDPHVFYHRIRPFLAGSQNMGEAGLPNGVLFDDGSGRQPYVQNAGGSNAQSSLIQFIDLALGVPHRPAGTRPGQEPDSEEVRRASAPSHNFIHEMRRYMPGPHAAFLQHVGEAANINEYVKVNRHDKGLSTAYDACLAMMRDFRDRHIQMVSRYIIVKSRESRSHNRSASPRDVPPESKRVNIANSFSPKSVGPQGAGEERRKLRGTGGTALIPFLKQARDETGEPSIGNWARRILTDRGDGRKAPLGTVDEHANGQVEIVGLAGIWSVDDSEGGICHW